MAVVLGTDSGFVTVAPTADPAGTNTTIDGSSVVTKDTSPVGAATITEIGWYRGSGTNGANFEVGLYADSAGAAGSRLQVDNTNSSTAGGWITTAVNWAISPSTAYWLALQMDAHSGSSTVDTNTAGGSGSDVLTSQTTLNDPYGGGAVADADGMYAIYALVTLSTPAINKSDTVTVTENVSVTILQPEINVGGASSVNTYYFNALHPTDSDPGSVWTNDANAVNGNEGNYADCSTAGTEGSNYLRGAGTTAPASGLAILGVRARVYGYTNNGRQLTVKIYTSGLAETLGTLFTMASTSTFYGWGNYYYVSAPSGGWTWSALQNLEFKGYTVDGNELHVINKIEFDVVSSVNGEWINVSESASTEISSPAISVSDSVSVVDIPRYYPDQIDIDESVSLAIVSVGEDLSISVSDGVSTSENVVLDIPINTSVSDSDSISENVSLTVSDPQVSVQDTVGSSENVIADITTEINVSDTTPLTENVVVVNELLYQNVSDSINTTESIKAELQSFVSVSDSLIITEEIKALQISDILVSDNVSTTESVSENILLEVSASDNVSVSENVLLSITTEILGSDTVVTSENMSLDGIPNINVSDSASVSENVVINIEEISGLQVVATDNISVGENVIIQISDAEVVVSDTIGTSESVRVDPEIYISTSDTVGTTENKTTDVSISPIVSDSSTLSESVFADFQIPVNVSDTITTNEDRTILIQEATPINLPVSDTVTTNEQILIVVSDPQVSTTDTVSTSENVLVYIQTEVVVQEVVNISENVSSFIYTDDINVSVSDDVSVSETVSVRVSDPQVSVSDSASISENVSITIYDAGFSVSVSDNVSVDEFARVSKTDLDVSVVGNVSGYAKRRQITIDYTNIAEDLVNFPMSVDGTYSYLATTGNGGEVYSSSGYDIIFTQDKEGTQPLDFERELYTPTTGEVVFWVRLPYVSSTQDTIIYMFYGKNGDTDHSNAGGVWDENFIAVYHLGEASGTVFDSTNNNNDSEAVFNVTQGSSAIVGKGISTNAADDAFIRIPDAPNLDSGDITVELLHNYTAVNEKRFVSRHKAFEDDTPWIIGSNSSNQYRLFITTGTLAVYDTGVAVPTSTDTHAAMRYDSSQHKLSLVVGGTEVYSDTTPVGSLVNSNNTIFIANLQDAANPPTGDALGPTGKTDEVRISRVARSDAWLSATKVSLLDPANFYSISDEQGYTDTVSVSENYLSNLNIDLYDSDLISVTENIKTSLEIGLTISDNITVSESFLGDIGILLSSQDQVTVSESATLDILLNVISQDILTVSEYINLVTAFSLEVNDTISTSESVNVTTALNTSVSDNINTNEIVNIYTILEDISILDTIGVVESVLVQLFTEDWLIGGSPSNIWTNEDISSNLWTNEANPSSTWSTEASSSGDIWTRQFENDNNWTLEDGNVVPAIIDHAASDIPAEDNITLTESVSVHIAFPVVVSDTTGVTENSNIQQGFNIWAREYPVISESKSISIV